MSIRLAAWAALAATLSLVGCGGGGGGIGGTGAPMGTAQFSVTDAPACGFDAVNITIEKVRVHQSAAAGDNDGGWSEVVLSPAKRVDLLALTNGVLEDLGQTQLPAGTYTQLRLVLSANNGAHPLANSVVPTGAAEIALTTPSGQQSGIKLNVNLQVEAGKVADFVLDFDACKSVVKRGTSGEYNLKPVVSVIPVISDAGLRVVGFVDPAIALGSTTVSVQLDGKTVKSTPPDAAGRFVLYPVPVGQYDLVVTAAGRATAVMTGVPVTTTAPTQVNSAAVPIVPAASTTRSVDGTVTPADATVRALQTLTGGHKVEVQWAAVDALTGAFGLVLPVQAPVSTAYVPNPASLSFTPDAAVAGKYTLEATSSGSIKTQAIDVTSAVPPVSFTFP
ncbi:MAG TPA: DUF4382 domain-containing protein [Albitalea sp.]|uniref:DUF4382 domain-containing protein n=1 Tax=Piscinibacter sp. TaxID=1903157 RepID=UPI002ED3AD4C